MSELEQLIANSVGIPMDDDEHIAWARAFAKFGVQTTWSYIEGNWFVNAPGGMTHVK